MEDGNQTEGLERDLETEGQQKDHQQQADRERQDFAKHTLN